MHKSVTVITDAWAQCGETPPYNCLRMPTQVIDGVSYIKIAGEWVVVSSGEPKPKLERYWGMPVAGIATSWETEPPGYTRLWGEDYGSAGNAKGNDFHEQP